MIDPGSYRFQPELFTRDGRVIRSVADAIAYVRYHEARPGVDDRDEVLHGLERARTEPELNFAVEAFTRWARELDLLVPKEPVTSGRRAPGSDDRQHK
jgi:hypothetical protein